ncbi:MAG: hypothetical protein ACQEUB_12105 [Thermodesulfobacteriota bacterium]
MRTTTIRISTEAHALLRQIAQEENEPMQSVLNRILHKHRREQLLMKTNAAFSELQKNPDQWKEEQKERALWEQTLADDLELE